MKFLCFLWIFIPIVIGKSIKEEPAFITVPQKYGDITKLQHSFGRNEDGQVLIGFESRHVKFPMENNVVLTVNYPEPGVTGKRVTVIIINVNQTSTLGKAFILEGGWDRNFVKFYVEANRTTLFDYDYKIYGKD